MIDPTVAQILIAIIINVPFWYVMRANFRKTNSEVDSSNVIDALRLKSEYKSDLKEMRDQLEQERTARYAVEAELTEAREMIVDLQHKYALSEATMNKMRSDFDNDKIVRDEVVLALTEKVRKLEELLSLREKENAALRDQLLIETSERDSVIVNLQSQISQLQSKHGGR